MLKKSSVSVAKSRLRTLVTSDRVLCLPESYDMICNELYNVLSKYIELTKDDFYVDFQRTHITIQITGENL